MSFFNSFEIVIKILNNELYISYIIYEKKKIVRYAIIVIQFYIEYNINYQKNGCSPVKIVL